MKRFADAASGRSWVQGCGGRWLEFACYGGWRGVCRRKKKLKLRKILLVLRRWWWLIEPIAAGVFRVKMLLVKVEGDERFACGGECGKWWHRERR